MNTKLGKFLHQNEKGQSIVLIALVFVGLLAFIGLTVDLGVLFISYGNLRRAVDNAALAAATEMRQDYQIDQLKYAAANFLRLNNVDVNDDDVDIQTCKTNPTDVELSCTSSSDKRKMVRITASVPVQFSFLPVIGMYGTTITASAIGEAASMDVVLVIDISESMAIESGSGLEMWKTDPTNCNALDPVDTDDHNEIHYNATYPTIPGECHPFEEVKAAAGYTLNKFILDQPALDEQDRLAVVVFSNGWQPPNYEFNGQIPTKGTAVICPNNNVAGDPTNTANLVMGNCKNPWMDDYDQAFNLITHLKVYEPPRCALENANDITDPGACAMYIHQLASPVTEYEGITCPLTGPSNILTGPKGDGSSCQTTNIGGGLQLGASLFGINMRKDALWLLILLTDGAANATTVTNETDSHFMSSTGSINPAGYILDEPLGNCPDTLLNPPGKYENNIGCHDYDYSAATGRHTSTDPQYDAEDYAKDMADLVSCDGNSKAPGCNSEGQGAIMFAIGLGSEVQKVSSVSGVRAGDVLLRYIAAVGDDGNPGTGDACTTEPDHSASYSCGNYYFANTSKDLDPIFEQIASRVFTKLTK